MTPHTFVRGSAPNADSPIPIADYSHIARTRRFSSAI